MFYFRKVIVRIKGKHGIIVLSLLYQMSLMYIHLREKREKKMFHFTKEKVLLFHLKIIPRLLGKNMKI